MGRPLARSFSPPATVRLGAPGARRALQNASAVPARGEEPWWMESAEDSDGDGWMLSYLDILTLLLTLFVVIVAVTQAELQKRSIPAPAPATPVNAAPPTPTIASTTLAQDASAATLLPLRSSEPSPPLASAEPSQPAAAIALTAHTTAPAAPEAAHRPDAELAIAAVSAETLSAPLPEAAVAIETPAPDAPAPQPHNEAPSMDVSDAVLEEPAPIAPAQVMPLSHSEDRAADDKNSLATLGNTGWMQVQVGERGVMIALGEDVLFSAGSASLASQSVPPLDALASILAEMPYTIWVEGHTDNSPIATAAFPSNWELSAARATAVTRYLVERGLAPQRLRAVGYGETQPRSSNDTAEGRSQNRRVVFRVEMPPTAAP